MHISELSIKNSVFAWMLMLALIVFGWISFNRLPVSQMPDVDFPVITVNVTLEGAAPEIMETEVVDVIEDAITTVEGIKNITSTSREGSCTVKVELELDRDIDAALQDIQTKIAQAQKRLPTDIDPPTMVKTNPEDQPIMWVGFSGEGKTLRQLVDYAQDRLRPMVQTVPGVGEVILGGFIERNMRVWVDRDKLNQYDLTISDVVHAIQSQHKELPAGRIETELKEYSIRLMGEARSVEDLEKLKIYTRGGRPIYQPIPLSSISRIEDDLDDIRRLSRINHKPAIGLGIKKQRGSNAVAVATQIKSRLAEMNKTLPEGFNLAINFDSTQFIEESIHELSFEMILSAVLTSLICWLFLGSFASTLNVLFAIPTSLFGTFVALYFLGFSLNTFTLLGLTLAIGIVVDDAIMVLENITRHREMGKSRFKSALDGSLEISFAALAATVAVIAIFLPVAFMQGIIGKFFFQFGVAISVAVGLSLLEALTLTPMRMSRFGKTHASNFLTRSVDNIFSLTSRIYKTCLAMVLRFKWVTLITAFIVFAASLFLFKSVRKEFVPSQDQSRVLIRIQTTVGSSLELTDSKFKVAEKWLTDQTEVLRYFSAVGGFGGGEVDTGMLFVTLRSSKDRTISQADFMKKARNALNNIEGLKAVVIDLSQGGFSAERGFPVEFSIRGPEWDQLAKLSTTISKEMQNQPEFVDVDSDYRSQVSEIHVIPNRKKAFERGVDIQSISQVLQTQMGGERVGKFTKEGHRYDIRVKLVKEDRADATDIKKLFVRNYQGELISLAELVTLEEKPSPQSITRRNRERSVGIFSNISEGISQSDAIEKAKLIAKKHMPEGYTVVFTGGSQAFQDSFKSLLFALLLGILVSYMVLASQFNSFLHPWIILLALPFSITGAAAALFISGKSLNIYSMIGLLLLMGLVKKNSILLVEFTNEVRKRGLNVRQALLESCPIRLRPILMTSIATIAAAVPPALGLGAGSETRVPMALVVIGGVLVSTVFTLLVVPCAYEAFSFLESKRKPETEP